MKPDPDAEMSLAVACPTSNAKTGSILGKNETPDESLFLWRNCESADQRDRVDVKEQAVFDGFRLGDTIVKKWRKLHETQATENTELADWVKKFEHAKTEHRTRHGPIVGFLGVLGAGKSSLINALLDQEELLASSSDRAATAVACEVAYNHDSSGYRAEIIYRTRESLIDELDKMFEDLKYKAQLETRVETLEGNTNDNDTNDSEADSLNKTINEIQENIRPTVDTVTEIWGVNQDDLLNLSTQELLETKSYGVEYLGTTRHISGIDKEEFAEELSSYLKSSSEDDTESELPLCPLIEKVTVYVKSPILKYGLRLRDLPGLCDVSEARKDVALKNSKDLDITMIVAPAIRATEESTVTSLIKGRQEIQMKMDGKFNRGSFCVVLSKIDDIKSETYLKQLKTAKTNKNIQSKLRRRKELDAAFGRANSRKLTAKTPIPGQPSPVSGGNAELEKTQREAAAIKDWLEHAAVFLRTQDITSRVQKKFQNHHKDAASTKNTVVRDEAVEVFGISSKAYWTSKEPDGVKLPGFPDEKYSGIPRLRQWLFETTFAAREDHLDATLCKLWGLLMDIDDLAGLKSTDSQMATVADAQELQKIHNCFFQELTNLLKQSGVGLSQIKPLKEKESALLESQRQCGDIVTRWGHKDPDDKNGRQKIHVHVQTCILRKGGESYTPRTTSTRHTYCWLYQFTKPYYDSILGSWNQAFQGDVPAYVLKVMDLAEPAWQRYGTLLARRLRKWPGAKLEHDPQIQAAIEIGKNDMKGRVRDVLTALSTRAQDVHLVFRQEVKKSLIPIFETAAEIHGSGARANRDRLLHKLIEKDAENIFRAASEKMEGVLMDDLRQTATNLEKLAHPIVSLVDKRVQPLFGLGKAVGNPASETATRDFLKANGHVMASWKLCWKKSSSQRDDHVMRGDMRIPEPLGLFNAE